MARRFIMEEEIFSSLLFVIVSELTMTYQEVKPRDGSDTYDKNVSICLNLKNGELEASLTSFIIGRIRSPLAFT